MLEPVGMALIAVISLLLVRQEGVARALPLLGALALEPSGCCQWCKVYESWAQTAIRKAVCGLCCSFSRNPCRLFQTRGDPDPDPESWSAGEAVRFGYAPDCRCARYRSTEIRRGERIGIVAATGGKNHWISNGATAPHGRQNPCG